MSTAIDANVLIVAANEAEPSQGVARAALDSLIGSAEEVFLFWPVLMAFLRVSTHPALFPNPLTVAEATATIDDLWSRPNVHVVAERDGFWNVYQDVARTAGARGKLVHDAHIVALMKQHEVRTIWTSDRDFRRFDGIRVVNPLA